MYTNKCIKCGKEFETKNPKRVICPECLYPERTTTDSITPVDENGVAQDYSRGYSAGSGNPEGYQRKYNNRPQNNQGGYNRPQQGGYQRPQGGYNRPQGGGFNRQGGRPQQYADEDIWNLHKQGLTDQEIADNIGCAVKTVQRKLTKFKEDEI